MGTVGYWVGEPYARKGFTLAATQGLTAFALGRLGLHRLGGRLPAGERRIRRLLLRAGYELGASFSLSEN